jgi:hypothetical protein
VKAAGSTSFVPSSTTTALEVGASSAFAASTPSSVVRPITASIVVDHSGSASVRLCAAPSAIESPRTYALESTPASSGSASHRSTPVASSTKTRPSAPSSRYTERSSTSPT